MTALVRCNGPDGWADFSDDEAAIFRFRLFRDLRLPLLRSAPPASTCAFIMLNPSTADHEKPDPTVTRCMGYARDWGFDALQVVNLYAFRATYPRDLVRRHRAGEDCVGPLNLDLVLAESRAADLTVCAWGRKVENMGARSHNNPWWNRVARGLRVAGVKLHALTVTQQGHPGHPLYLAADLKPQPWAPPDWAKKT